MTWIYKLYMGGTMGLYFNRKQLKNLRKTLRKRATGAEKILWQFLKRRQIEGCKFRRQHGIGRYVVDFYCPELSLVIEVDGASHDSEEAHMRDARRQQEIEQHDITVLRIRDEVVRYDIHSAIEKVRSEVLRLKGKPPSA